MLTKTVRIGVVGYCPPTKFDEKLALDYIVDAYNRVSADFHGCEITIVSGLTYVGVLKIAYEEAKRRSWKTAGVACKKAQSHLLFPVDETPLIVGEKWGDESDVFINGTSIPGTHHEHGLDAIIRIGVGEQSIKETEFLKSKGKPTYEYDLPRIE